MLCGRTSNIRLCDKGILRSGRNIMSCVTSQLFNLCELRQIHATDFASEGSLTVGIVFIRVTCKLFEFLGFLLSGHVTFQIWS